MAEGEKEHLSGAEEYITAEIELAEPLNADQEKNLRNALEKLAPEAFDSVDLGSEKISLCYDPTRTREEDLLRLIKQAGGKLKHIDIEASPLLED